MALQETGGAEVVSVPGISSMEIARLLPMLTTDVLMHTWDLATAVGEQASLDPDLVVTAYEEALRDSDKAQASGMFGPPVPVADNADVVTKLVALLGRDPAWRAPSR